MATVYDDMGSPVTAAAPQTSSSLLNRSIIGRTIDSAAAIMFAISNYGAWLACCCTALFVLGLGAMYLNPDAAMGNSWTWWRTVTPGVAMTFAGLFILALNTSFRSVWGERGGLRLAGVTVWYFICTAALAVIFLYVLACAICFIIFDLSDCAGSQRCTGDTPNAKPTAGALIWFISLCLIEIVIAVEFVVQLYLYYAVGQVVTYIIMSGNNSFQSSVPQSQAALVFSRIGAPIGAAPQPPATGRAAVREAASYLAQTLSGATGTVMQFVSERLGDHTADDIGAEAEDAEYIGSAMVQHIGANEFQRIRANRRIWRNRIAFISLVLSYIGAVVAAIIHGGAIVGMGAIAPDYLKAFTASWTWWRLVTPVMLMSFVAVIVLWLNYNFVKVFGRMVANSALGRANTTVWYFMCTLALAAICAYLVVMFAIYFILDWVHCSSSPYCTLSGGTTGQRAGTWLYLLGLISMVGVIAVEIALQLWVYYDIVRNTREENSVSRMLYLTSRINTPIASAHHKFLDKFAPALLYGDAALGGHDLSHHDYVVGEAPNAALLYDDRPGAAAHGLAIRA